MRLFVTFLSGMILWVLVFHLFAATDREIIALKRAGVGDELLGVIIKEKILETCAFSVDEIVSMKQAGIEDATLKVIIKEGSFLKGRAPIIYGKSVKSLKATSIDDIIKLKESGISDDIIKAIIIFHSGSSNEAERLKAWEMMKSFGIIIDSPGSESK